ncbi:histidine ammonia-lyase [Halovivax gelatinilyticus]|uniref:histidine ammonia-lyase n=1 Tax=Halovivax gelatinilyticus TaxID=2961597 RepID=UPI0020CA8CC6|nr:histidine ammonia-lyase [Halovivax gelatinilyticus]
MGERGSNDPVRIDGETLTPRDVERVARFDAPVTVTDEARERVELARERIADVVASGEPVYGVNTGFGELVDEQIPPDELERLQHNLLRSHASGAGEPLEREAVRAMLVTRLNALAKGYSGVRPIVVDHLVTMLNERIHPVVRSRGSLGASGDLAPLAHMALVLIGEGEAIVEPDDAGDGNATRRHPGDEALATAGLDPLSLAPKEGLALINGTQLTVGLAALLTVDAERTVEAADAAGALTTEVTMGSTVPSHPALTAVRPHPGHEESAEQIRALTADSEIVESHRNCDRVQDAYSLRCQPQVHGAVREALSHLREAVERELNSATDNPLVFDADDADPRASGTDRAAVLSGGNFHGEPLALRLDYATSALTELAAISERRIDRTLNPNLQEPHLPPFLAVESGVESGYMIAQYTAASLVNENRSLGRPSMDNTPVSGGQEDHVSMSAQSAAHAKTALGNARHVIATELCTAAEAAEYVDDALTHGRGTGAVYDLVRDVVPPLDGDRPLTDDVEAVAELIADGTVDDRIDSALE